MSDNILDFDSMPNMDMEKLHKVLKENSDKNFVKRIIDRENYPTMDLPEDGQGNWGTHKMSYSSVDDGFIVYPEIIQKQDTGELIKLGRKEAVAYAIKTGEYIKFQKESQAKWFGKHYKDVWDNNWQDKGRWDVNGR